MLFANTSMQPTHVTACRSNPSLVTIRHAPACLPRLQKLMRFAAMNRERKLVIHCKAGKNRSIALAAAVFAADQNISWKEAVPRLHCLLTLACHCFFVRCLSIFALAANLVSKRCRPTASVLFAIKTYVAICTVTWGRWIRILILNSFMWCSCSGLSRWCLLSIFLLLSWKCLDKALPRSLEWTWKFLLGCWIGQWKALYLLASSMWTWKKSTRQWQRYLGMIAAGSEQPCFQ